MPYLTLSPLLVIAAVSCTQARSNGGLVKREQRSSGTEKRSLVALHRSVGAVLQRLLEHAVTALALFCRSTMHIVCLDQSA